MKRLVLTFEGGSRQRLRAGIACGAVARVMGDREGSQELRDVSRGYLSHRDAKRRELPTESRMRPHTPSCERQGQAQYGCNGIPTVPHCVLSATARTALKASINAADKLNEYVNAALSLSGVGPKGNANLPDIDGIVGDWCGYPREDRLAAALLRLIVEWCADVRDRRQDEGSEINDREDDL